MADELYRPPTRVAPPSTGTAAEAEKEKKVLEAFYPNSGPRDLRTPPPGELYWSTLTHGVVDQHRSDLFNVAGMGTADQDNLLRRFVTLERQTRLPGGVVAKLAEKYIAGLLAGHQPKTDEQAEAAEVALHQRMVDGNAQVRQALVAQYGARDTEDLLARTNRFVRSHRDLAALLGEHGLASDSEVVRGIVSHVFSTGWR